MQQRNKLGEYGKDPSEKRQRLEQGCSSSGAENWFNSVYFQDILAIVWGRREIDDSGMIWPEPTRKFESLVNGMKKIAGEANLLGKAGEIRLSL